LLTISIFYWVKVRLWPGSKGITRKKHRREKNSLRRSPHASAEDGGRIGPPAGRPYIGLTLFLGKEWLARPAQEMRVASWFLRVMPLLPGQAMTKIQSA
jgi:hypothetical protein